MTLVFFFLFYSFHGMLRPGSGRAIWMLTCCVGGDVWCLCMLNGAAVTFVLPFSLGFCLLKPTSGSYSVVCHAITPRRGFLACSLGGCSSRASGARRCTWRRLCLRWVSFICTGVMSGSDKVVCRPAVLATGIF